MSNCRFYAVQQLTKTWLIFYSEVMRPSIPTLCMHLSLISKAHHRSSDKQATLSWCCSQEQ